jgi:hypothetical protein
MTIHDPLLLRSTSSMPPQNHQENHSRPDVFTQSGSGAGMAQTGWTASPPSRIAAAALPVSFPALRIRNKVHERMLDIFDQLVSPGEQRRRDRDP